MPVRKADAVWKGSLREGAGNLKLESGGYDGPYTFKGRTESDKGTNPEELLGGAHAACYAMFLSAKLSGAGYTVNQVHANAAVSLGTDGGLKVTGIHLTVEANIGGIDAAKFAEFAEEAKTGCPISQALAAVPMTLDAKLVSS
jgi:osmotically inducible protein OsmC